MLDYILLGIIVVVIILALKYIIKHSYNKNKKVQKISKNQYSLAKCPLCASPLYKQDLFSRIFRPMTVNDQRCIILGCPHCYPVKEATLKRICPVCHKTVSQKGHLVARLFNKTKDGKKHVIITGCTTCCKYEIE